MRIAARIGLGLLVASALVVTRSGAQEEDVKSDTKSESTETKRATGSARRVPAYFGQIGLTPEQKESIYKIRARHQAEIDALEKQIAELHAKMLTECEGVLTDDQKRLLEHRRRAAASSKKPQEPARPAKETVKSSS